MAALIDDPVVEPSDVGAKPGALALDVRDEASFAAGRLRGAVRTPLAQWEAAAKDPQTDLNNSAFWETEIGALGLDGARPALIYDDGRMIDAARIWFLLQHFGQPSYVVNGGWRALAAQSGLIETDAPASVRPTLFRARPGAGAVGLVERKELRAELDSGIRIFDSRTPDEFSGLDLRKNARGGHLPNATNLAHADLLGPDGRLLEPQEVETRLAAAGFKPDDRIVTHCDAGGRAALAAIAALRSGYKDIRLYYLSFSDWAKDEACPIVRD